jgi:methylmalonyl-CoA mutase cobalamin-binding subunit
MAKVNLSVSVKEEHRPHFAELVKQLKKSGLTVDQELHTAGVVTGSIESEKVQELKKLAGVAHVEESRNFQISPPGSDVQ